MLFNSLEFLLFLPLVFFLYWFVCNKKLLKQNILIVLSSYLFYGWWDWRFSILLAFTSLCSWGSGILIFKASKSTTKKFLSPKFWLWANIIINLVILGFFKYFNFFLSSFVSLFNQIGFSLEAHTLSLILPVGISFYTFQALSYSIDVYKTHTPPTYNVIDFFAYLSFFPQLVAGPIERSSNLLPQIQKPRVFDYTLAVDGCRQILWGFFKKVVVADNCAIIANQIFSDYTHFDSPTLLIGALFFTFQIYGDFSGYSDIAIGIAKLFGIKLIQNFHFPYFSRNIAEFWRRWHISLMTWFRDYIYIPLGGNRCSKAKMIRNTFIIFFISGLWHGANWTFIVWGLYHALLFLPLLILGKNKKQTSYPAYGRKLPSIKEIIQIFITFILVVFGWILFRSNSISDAYSYIERIFNPEIYQIFIKFFTYSPYHTLFILTMLLVEWLQRDKEYGLDISNKYNTAIRWSIYCGITLLIFSFCAPQSEFIYFHF